jgi:flagellin
MKITTNPASLQAQNALTSSSTALDRALAVLASGRRINAAADDAAGLGVATQQPKHALGLL